MAIVDADNCMTAPRGLTAASGIDVMTHAIESYVSIMASDYTKGLSERAAKLVFENLPSSFTNGAKDPHAREEMHNASCMAGMAFANAFLGLNHSMAHKLGAFHHLPHGLANAVILTRVMRYNAAEAPVKMGTFSQYPYPNALHNYAEMAKYCGIEGKDDKEVFENFITKLEELKDFIGVKKTIADYGVDEQYFLDTLDEMTEQAFNDQCTGANPRYPLMKEIKQMYLRASGLRRLLVLARFLTAGVHGCFTHPRRRFYRIVERMQPCCYPIPRPSSSAVATRSFTTWATRSSRSLTRPSLSPTCSTRL